MNRAILCLLPLLLAAAPAPPIESLSLHQEIAVAQDARARESWSEAAAALARAQSHYARPDPLLAYDQAVCAYRAGDFLQAATAFEQATHTSDPALASAASYNLGNAQAQVAASKESPKDSAAEYRKALDAYRHAIRSLDQTIQDRAMANGELVMQRLQEEEQKQEQEQDQEQQNQDKQEQSEEQQEQQQQEQEQSEEQQEQQQQEQQQEQSEEQQEQQEQQQQEQEQSEEQQDQQQDQSKEQQSQQEDQSQQEQSETQQEQEEQPEQQEQPTPEEPAEEEQASTSGSDPKQTPDEMSQEEAERMLQAVRDRQRARRQAREEAEAAGTPPTGKDW